MSLTKSGEVSAGQNRSRKRTVDEAELEIDINAPEPPSKKALRKAKKRNGALESDEHPVERATSKPTSSTAALDGQDGKRSEHGIWIGNLSFNTTKKDLLGLLTGDHEHVIRENQITRIHLPMSTERKLQNKGFAYVDFNNASSSRTALELSETLLGGRRVLIKDARNFEGRPKGTAGDKEVPSPTPSKRIFVGNLAFDTTLEQLEKHFGVCGAIQHTHMATFEDSGKCKGYAWIEFEQLSSAETAMRGWVEIRQVADGEGNDTKSNKRKIWLRNIEGRKLRMEFAEDKTTRYNKRFGKNTNSDGSHGAQNSHTEDDLQTEGIVELPDTAPTAQPATRPKREPRGGKKPGKTDRGNSRYGAETVQKLTGAIIEGQGKKVVFD